MTNVAIRHSAMSTGILPALLLLLAMGVPGAAAEAQDADPSAAISAGTTATPQEVVELLQADSTRARGLDGLVLLAGTLPSDEATAWIQLLAISERISGELLARVAPAVLLSHEGEGGEAVALVDRIIADVQGRPAGEADEEPVAPFLALAAHMADRVDPAKAATYRERILDERPDDLEAPEAALLLARHYLRDPDRAPRGLTILENLIVRSPAHPVAPEARRLRQAAMARGVEPGPEGGMSR